MQAVTTDETAPKKWRRLPGYTLRPIYSQWRIYRRVYFEYNQGTGEARERPPTWWERLFCRGPEVL
jgi:hypothetical protein